MPRRNPRTFHPKTWRPRVPNTRPGMERLLAILRLIQDGQYPTAPALARAFEVSTKTVRRDVTTMREKMNIPVGYDAARNGYALFGPVETLPDLVLTEGELLALLVSVQAAEAYRGTPFAAELKRAVERMAVHFGRPVRVRGRLLKELISIRAPAAVVPPVIFENLSRGLLEEREVEFDYRKLESQAPERRRVRPYHLGCVHGQWYLVGHDVGRGALRTFALPRMADVTVRAETFERPAGFTMEEHLGTAWGIYRGVGDHRVRLRFTGPAAGRVREKFWHPSQVVADDPDGRGVVLELHLDNLEEIQGWIFGWGEDVEVLEPPGLAGSIGRRAAALAEKHGFAMRSGGA